jgi:hypothetical protein
MADRFDRFEQTKKSLGSHNSVTRFERWSSPHTHPGLSITRLAAQKLRVLTLFGIRRLVQGSGREAALGGMKSLEGFARGRDVLVLASGPSANSVNTREVAKRQKAGELVVVSTNYFLQSPLAKTITPDFLIWSDRIFHPRHRSENPSWDQLAETQNVRVVSPWTWRKHIPAEFTERVVFFDDDTLEGWSKSISPMNPRGYQGTTGTKAIAFAHHLSPRQVFLLGLDLSYFKNFAVDENNRVLRNPTHVAGTDSGSQDITHNSVNGLADSLYSTANQFLHLHTLFCEVNVVNLDPNSLVDAFPKATAHPLVKKQASKAVKN